MDTARWHAAVDALPEFWPEYRARTLQLAAAHELGELLAGGDGAPGIVRVAEHVGCCCGTVQLAIRRLIRAGLLVRDPRHRGGRAGNPDMFYLVLPSPIISA